MGKALAWGLQVMNLRRLRENICQNIRLIPAPHIVDQRGTILASPDDAWWISGETAKTFCLMNDRISRRLFIPSDQVIEYMLDTPGASDGFWRLKVQYYLYPDRTCWKSLSPSKQYQPRKPATH